MQKIIELSKSSNILLRANTMSKVKSVVQDFIIKKAKHIPIKLLINYDNDVVIYVSNASFRMQILTFKDEIRAFIYEAKMGFSINKVIINVSSDMFS
jgi:hypothetical protein